MPQAFNPKGFRPAFDDAPVMEFPEAASQTFAVGDAVILSSGKVAIGLAASAEILGVAAEPSSGTTDTPIKVWADPNTIFVGRANDANAILAGASCDIIGATGAMELDEDATSTNVVVIVNAVDTAEVTTSAGKQYRFKWQKHAMSDTST